MAAIDVEGLSKFFGRTVALDHVSFDVAAGTVFGLLGPNGAGKTTAIRILTTLARPDAGRASVLGLDVVRDARAVRRVIGLAGQFAAVDVNLTGRENLRLIGRLGQLPRPVFRSRADALLEQFELTAAASRPVRTYSGGMRRRLDVAAALMGRPPVLFFDEPTTGLDPHSRNELWGLIQDLVAEGTTVVLTTQYLEEADRLADRVAVIDQGALIANDTPLALKTQLGGTVVEIDVADGSVASAAAALLLAPFGSRLRRIDTRLQITAEEGSRALIDALHLLDHNGLVPTSVRLREPTLDDVFLRLTGSHNREPERDEGTDPEGSAA